MCGIVGIAGNQEPTWLTQMNTLITYRFDNIGPWSSWPFTEGRI